MASLDGDESPGRFEEPAQVSVDARDRRVDGSAADARTMELATANDDDGAPLPPAQIAASYEEEAGTKTAEKAEGKVELIQDEESPAVAPAFLPDGPKKLKNEKSAFAMAPARRDLESVDDLPPYNLAEFQEEEDSKVVKKQILHGARQRDEESIIIPTRNDIEGDAAVAVISGGRDYLRRNHDESINHRTIEDDSSMSDAEAGLGLERDRSTQVIPEAFLVEEDDAGEVVIATLATPSLPWWKQWRTRLLLVATILVVVALATGLGVSLSGDEVPTSVESNPAQFPTQEPSPPLLASRYTSVAQLAPDEDIVSHWSEENLAIHGNTAVVGAPENDDDKGAAFLFALDDGKWKQQAKLVAPDGSTGDKFGWSVAIFGDTALIGAQKNGESGGAAYVFVRRGDEWKYQDKLLPPGGASDMLVASVALYGSTATNGPTKA
ncbi:hypothetical protein ACHAXT_001842 [Thalassiosira profunda]